MRDVRPYLNHIIEAIDRIRDYTSEGFPTFAASQKTQDAVIRQMEIIGEAARRVRDATATRVRQSARENPFFLAHPLIPWKAMIDFRQLAQHEYERIDLDLVWQAVMELPAIRRALLAIRNVR